MPGDGPTVGSAAPPFLRAACRVKSTCTAFRTPASLWLWHFIMGAGSPHIQQSGPGKDHAAAESGIDLVTLAKLRGHSRVQMVMRYAHPTQKHQSSAMENLDKHVAVAEARERLEEQRRTRKATLEIGSRAS